MKVFVIENKKGEIFNVENKTRFCKEFSLTPRLLDYTKGVSKNRPQEWHKEYKISEIVNFIESDDGEKVLWDNGVNGYFLKSLNEEKTKSKIVEDIIDEKYTYVSPNEEEIKSLQKELTKVHRQKQKLQDQLTLNKKIMREQFRYENMCDVVRNSCEELIKDGVPKVREVELDSSNSSIAILTLSDWHLGEKIEETNNYFNSEVASDRAQKIFEQFEKEIYLRNIDEIYILMLGDFIYSQSVMTKPDMKLSGEFPEITSAINCFKILAPLIDRFTESYKVNLSGCVGNESRWNNHMNMSTLKTEAQNNLDTLIFEMLNQRYSNNPNVRMIGNCDEIESVIEIGNRRFLMTHGHQKFMNHRDLDKTFVNIKARLEPIYGEIDFMVLGHIHSTLVTDRIARNSSLVGSNSYSNELGFPKSFISQNMLLIEDNVIRVMPLNITK